MSLVTIATIDEMNAEVVREALDDAEIEAELVPIKPFVQLEILRNQHRAQLDVRVAEERVGEARELLDQLADQAGAAVEAEADAYMKEGK